jgi:NADH-quinone oxidoreductase subunit N
MEWLELLPIVIVLGAGVIGVVLEAFLPREMRRPVQLALTFGALIAALVAVVLQHDTAIIAASGAIAVDGPALFLQGTILAVSIVAVLFFADRKIEGGGGDAFTPSGATLPGSGAEQTLTRLGVLQTEVYPLTLFAIGGMLLFPAANDLLMLFVALEVLSLPLYLLCALARRRRLLSQEAAMKYFLLGAYSSAFFLFGSALVYGYSGSITFEGIDAALAARVGQDGLLLAGVALIAVGLLFKVSAVPFHEWTPDAYQGAPTPVTGFMAAATKVAAFGAMLRIFYVAFGGVRTDWQPMFWLVAVVTMLFGVVVAVTQTDVKRMLAYSSIAHAGFIMVGVVVADEIGTAAVLVYLATYAFATVGAFAIVMLVRDAGGEATHLAKWAGLGKRSPVVAGVFALFLLSLAGIPLTSGFIGKLAVFSAGIEGGALPLVIVALVASAIAVFFYVRVIVLMFFSDPVPDGPSVVVPSLGTVAGIAAAAALTVVLGIVPGPLLDLANDAAIFIR